MLQVGLQMVMITVCFVEMIGIGIAPMLSVGSLMLHLLIYFGTLLFVPSRYKPMAVVLDVVVISLICARLHPSGILLMILIIMQHWDEKASRWTLLIGGIVIGYIWLTGNGHFQMLYDGTDQYIKEVAFMPLAIVSVMALMTQRKMQKQLNSVQALQEITSLELLEMKREKETLAKHQKEAAYIAKISERSLVAQKLHDKIGHTLAGNIMRLEVVKIMVEQDPSKAQVMLSEITDHLRAGMDDIRQTLRAIKPEESEVGIHTVKEMLGGVETQMAIRSKLYFEGDLKAIHLLQWQVITENLREALTNLKKYSTADCFEVRIHVYNKRIQVQLKDNGCIEGTINKGLGLRGMEERTLKSSGIFRMHTSEGLEIMMLWER